MPDALAAGITDPTFLASSPGGVSGSDPAALLDAVLLVLELLKTEALDATRPPDLRLTHALIPHDSRL